MNAYDADVTDPVMKLVAQLAVPNKDPVRSLRVALPFNVKLPEILTDPVNVCVFAVMLPNTLLPELNTTDELTVVTTKVCAVRVPLNNALEAVIFPLTSKLPVNEALVLTTNPLFGDIEAVELPLAICERFKPTILLAEILVNPLPFPKKDPLKEPDPTPIKEPLRDPVKEPDKGKRSCLL